MPTLHGDASIPARFRRHLPIIFIAVAFAIVGILSLNDLCLYTPDSTRYLVWAKSLSNFDGFKDATLPDPERYVVHAPLFAILLAPVARFFPLSILAAKVWTLLFGVAALVGFYQWLLRATNRRTAIIGALLLACNPLFLLYSTEVLSDIPFAVCLILFFMLIEKIATDDAKEPPLISLLVIVTCGILLREIGFSLMFSAVAYFVLRKKYRSAALSLLVPLAVYALWYVRNEIIIAGSELPAMTNSKLFVSHFFTPQSESFLEELLARASMNVIAYGKFIGSLVLYPLYATVQYDVVSRATPSIVTVLSVLEFGKYALILLTVGLSLYGLTIDVRLKTSGVLRLLFLLFYVGIILVYPINDIRFLVPMLILMIYYCVKAGEEIVGRFAGRSWVSRVIALVLIVLLLPNLVWSFAFIRNTMAYRQSPIDFYESVKSMPRYPSHYTQPLPMAGKWIAEHSDSSTVVLAQWKDLVCSLQGRKLLNTDQTILLDEFENILRDYKIHYVVAAVQKNGLREFEFQIDQLRKFDFKPAARFANVEVLKVERRTPGMKSIDDITPFRKGLGLLEGREYRAAESVLDSVYSVDSLNLAAMFYAAVAKEFAMNLNDADGMFEKLRTFPQAGMYLQLALVHQNIISTLRAVDQMPLNTDRADTYFRLAVRTWNLGFRSRARELLDVSLSNDSSFTPALAFGVHFALEDGDTAESKAYLGSAKNIQPSNPLVMGFSDIFAHLDSLHIAERSGGRSRHLLTIAKDYQAMGLTDKAIDCLLDAVHEEDKNSDALMMLSQLCIAKRRFAPARDALLKILLINPNNQAAGEALSIVMKRFD